MSNELIKKHLSLDQRFIKKIPYSSPLTDKKELYSILTWWVRLSGSSSTVGDLNGKKSDPTPLVHFKKGDIIFKIHSDTTKDGVKEFLKNKENPWLLIENKNGYKNLVTNHINKKPIKGFYMYRV